MSAELLLACPSCGRTNEAHDGPDPEAKPASGDVSICWGCRAIAVYADTAFGLTLRQPTEAEAEELARDPQVLEALAAAAESYTPAQAAELRWRT